MRKNGLQFSTEAIQHIYHRAVDHGVIHYSMEDRLVYYTLAAVKARKHHITVYSGSLMFTHIHQSVQAPSLSDLRNYLHDTHTSFARLYNAWHKRDGNLFERPIGRAQKMTSKEKRTNLIYVFNNHVEKRLCSSATQERWSFLAYASSEHPFSGIMDPDNASGAMRKAIKLVKRRIKKLKGLEYCDLDRILPAMDKNEKEQFLDFVISHYGWIDFKAASKLFGNTESMILAINSSTGSEYDIREEFSSHTDVPYRQMADLFERNGNIKYIFSLPLEEKRKLAALAQRNTGALKYHLLKYFHEE